MNTSKQGPEANNKEGSYKTVYYYVSFLSPSEVFSVPLLFCGFCFVNASSTRRRPLARGREKKGRTTGELNSLFPSISDCNRSGPLVVGCQWRWMWPSVVGSSSLLLASLGYLFGSRG